MLHLCPSRLVLPAWQPVLVSILTPNCMAYEPASCVRSLQSIVCSVWASVDFNLHNGALCLTSAPVSSSTPRLLCQFLAGLAPPKTGPQGKCIYLMLVVLCCRRGTDLVVVRTHGLRFDMIFSSHLFGHLWGYQNVQFGIDGSKWCV